GFIDFVALCKLSSFAFQLQCIVENFHPRPLDEAEIFIGAEATDGDFVHVNFLDAGSHRAVLARPFPGGIGVAKSWLVLIYEASHGNIQCQDGLWQISRYGFISVAKISYRAVPLRS